MAEATEKPLNFIEQIIEDDLAAGKNNGRILTRFPPEPNGYLHIGHAKSICLNFGVAQKYGGKTNLRFDDTNPVTEETEYVESIKADVKWLGFEWAEELYASDYFDQLYEFALNLIKKGLAYVDDSTSEEMAVMKGTPTLAGINSSYRDERSIEENFDLFTRMKNGDFAEGTRVLRAKINMASTNMLMRDPIIYRIKIATHHRTGDKWCIYPMYDFAHGQSDSIEQITHSICTLEFVPHRELYDWCIESLEIFPSKQYEFARLNLSYAITSKRKLLKLVTDNFVTGWDDPRMPTISGMRRRGYSAQSIREFCDRIGIAKRDNLIDVSLLEFCVREHLNKIATRVMAVLDPIKLIITNYPDRQVEELKAENNPEDHESGSRIMPFSREILIEKDDFMENPTKKYFRLGPGLMVRLKNAYIIKCDDIIKDENGEIVEIHCSYIENSRSGNDTSGINVKGTIHWVSEAQAVDAEVRIYDRLFKIEDPSREDGDFKEYLNPESLQVTTAKVEPALKNATLNTPYQFLRKGYFCLDADSTTDKLVFNKTVGLKDTWAKEAGK